MMRLLKLFVGLAAFVAIAWFGATVKLGSRTLFAHLRAIADTKESQELVDGTKQVAEPLVDDVRRRIGGQPTPGEATAQAPKATPSAGGGDAGAPQETVTADDKRRLRKLLGSAEGHAVHR